MTGLCGGADIARPRTDVKDGLHGAGADPGGPSHNINGVLIGHALQGGT